ncbi:hypothetical protein C8J56DRAFT_972081 [Mycena floridula]|nr:hypothetical protein C8J56DRAFT_972081 [Mycena floridula]
MSDAQTPASTRTSKACPGCRRDKTKCDGARPCQGCIRKGYDLSACTDACEACRIAKAPGCDGVKPCQRCQLENVPCVTDSSRPPRSAAVDRVKLACTNCRRDNKKCDNTQPCSRCVSRSEECKAAVQTPKLVKLRCEGCRQHKKRCDDNRPCGPCSEDGRDCVNIERKNRGEETRAKMACTNCRQNKIRCIGFPCQHCTRRKLECVQGPCKSCNRTGAVCTHRDGGPAKDDDNNDNGMTFI